MALDIHDLKAKGGTAGDKKKQTILIVGTFALVILAWLQLKKMNGATATNASTTPSATYTPSSAPGTPVSGSTGSTGATDTVTTSQLQTWSDNFSALLTGVSQQAQDNQSTVQAQLNALGTQQTEVATAEENLANAFAGLGSKVTDLTSLIGTTTVVQHPISLPANETPDSYLPNAGPAKPPAIYSPPTSVVFHINPGDSWNTISARTGESIAQLRANNGGQLNALAANKDIKVNL